VIREVIWFLRVVVVRCACAGVVGGPRVGRGGVVAGVAAL